MPLSLSRWFAPLVLAALPSLSSAQPAYPLEPLRLHAGPGAEYPLVSMLYPGAPVEVLACLPGYQWCDVVSAEGVRGWSWGGGLNLGWSGPPQPVIQFGLSYGVPLTAFIIGDYWERHYRHQPWFGDRHWHMRPPVVPLPPEPRWGWQAPFPPRWESPPAPHRHWHDERWPEPRREWRDDRWPEPRREWRDATPPARPAPPQIAPTPPAPRQERFDPPAPGPRFSPVPAPRQDMRPPDTPRPDMPRPDAHRPDKTIPERGPDGPRPPFGDRAFGR